MPLTKLRSWVEDSLDRLWFIPAILTVVAVGFVVLTLYIDRRWAGGFPGRGQQVGWLFQGGAAEAQELLGAIAGGIITVTGVVFSITLVTLQAAAEQFSSRLLRQFTSDRPSQLTLGIFTATYIYALLVLRTVREQSETGGPFVPALSVTVALVLALVAIGFLIFYISYLAREIQAANVLERVVKGTLHRIEHLFPEEIGYPAAPADGGRVVPPEPPAVVLANRAGYVSEVVEDALFECARGRLLIRMEVGVGAFVVPGTPLASVWPAERADAKVGEAVRDAFLIGNERTIHHDIEHGFIELSDIAAKALSSSVNDPTTATICIDRIAEALIALGRRDFPSPLRVDPDGRVWLIAKRTSFERVVAVVVDPIRHYGGQDPGVMRRLLEALGQVVRHVPESRHPPLLARGAAILRQAERAIVEPIDRAHIHEAGRWVGPEWRGAADERPEARAA